MRSRLSLHPLLVLFAGALFAFAALVPTSVLAQRTAETVERAPDRPKAGETTKMSTPAKMSTSASQSGHTPATTIENSNGNTILQTSEGGSLLVPGLGGAIPAEGAGVRMMWYPAQKAFRAGEVGSDKDGSQWNADSTGEYSVAFGDDTKASGGWSMAVGDQTVASDIEAVAMGFKTTASARGAVAMGKETTASADQAVAMGENTTVSASRATAMGLETEASGLDAVAMNYQTTASGEESVAMGNGTTASARDAVAMGENTTASASRATAMGLDTEASEPNAVAMGTLSKAQGKNAVAVGFDVLTNNEHSFVAGRCNNTVNGSLLVVGNGPLNSAGDACDSNNFSDALNLEENGDLTIAGSLTENSDRRLKTDIQPLGEEVLSALKEIDPVRFHFKDERTHPAGPQIGLIAQEVQNEFPELVTEGDDGMLSLSYTKFSAVLLKGLQTQQSTIEKQQAQINDLKAENENIKERLAALEAARSAPATAGLVGPWGLALLLGLAGLAGGVLWRRRS